MVFLICSFRLWCSSCLFLSFLSWHVLIVAAFESFVIFSCHIALNHHFFNLHVVASAVFLESMFFELCTTCSILHIHNRSCLSCFWALRFFVSFARLALINGYYTRLEHAHQFVSVDMPVFSCPVVSFWFLVSGMALIL